MLLKIGVFLIVLLSYHEVVCAEEDAEFPSLSVLGNKIGLVDDYYDDDDLVSTTPCCLPTSWEGSVASGMGYTKGRRSGYSWSFDQVHVDGTRHRVAGKKMARLGRGRHMNISYIILFKNASSDMYLFNPTARKCRHKTLRHLKWKPQCIPRNATLCRSFTLGPSSGGLSVQSWSFVGGRRAPQMGDRPHPRPRVRYAANIMVHPTNCVPVLMHSAGSFGRRADDQDIMEDLEEYLRGGDDFNRPHPRPRPGGGGGFMASSTFGNIVPRITDPSVFNVPSYCQHNTSTLFYDTFEDDEDETPTVIERLFLL